MNRKLVVLGPVLRPHGLKGAFVVQTSEGKESSLPSVSKVCFPELDPNRFYKPLETAWMPKGWILRLEGIGTIEEAKRFVFKKVAAPLEELPPLEEGEYYLDELLNFKVFRSSGEELGIFKAVERSHACDLWRITTPEGDLLVPATADCIERVDRSQKAIWIRI